MTRSEPQPSLSRNDSKSAPQTPGSEDDEERGLLSSQIDRTKRHDKPKRRDRTQRYDKPKRRDKTGSVPWMKSLRAIVNSSWINWFLVFLPLAWAAHFVQDQIDNDALVFAVCFLAIIPLESLFDWGGEQLALHDQCQGFLGIIIIITMKNAVEATLAIILLLRCELRLLQSTIIGVVLLHLLLVPGTKFMIGGYQPLQANRNRLNHMLLVLAVMTLVIPVVVFMGLTSNLPGAVNTLSDNVRGKFSHIGHGIAVLLLTVYVGSCISLYISLRSTNDTDGSSTTPNSDKEIGNKLTAGPYALSGTTSVVSLSDDGKGGEAEDEAEEETEDEEPEANLYACVVLLVVSMALVAVTEEFLVESIDFVRVPSSGIQEEWFGLILLPLLSFAADGTVSVVSFVRLAFRRWRAGQAASRILDVPKPLELPKTLSAPKTKALDAPKKRSEDRAIDLSIQFTLFWLPSLVLLGWITGKPFTLLFDVLEVTVLVATCLLVIYVTADAQINRAGGLVMISFYAIIAMCAWSYSGQPEVAVFNTCGESVAQAAASSTPTGIQL